MGGKQDMKQHNTWISLEMCGSKSDVPIYGRIPADTQKWLPDSQGNSDWNN